MAGRSLLSCWVRARAISSSWFSGYASTASMRAICAPVPCAMSWAAYCVFPRATPSTTITEFSSSVVSPVVLSVSGMEKYTTTVPAGSEEAVTWLVWPVAVP